MAARPRVPSTTDFEELVARKQMDWDNLAHLGLGHGRGERREPLCYKELAHDRRAYDRRPGYDRPRQPGYDRPRRPVEAFDRREPGFDCDREFLADRRHYTARQPGYDRDRRPRDWHDDRANYRFDQEPRRSPDRAARRDERLRDGDDQVHCNLADLPLASPDAWKSMNTDLWDLLQKVSPFAGPMGLPCVSNLPDPWDLNLKHIGLTPSAASVSTSAPTSKDSLSDPPSSEGRHEEKCLDEVQMCWAGAEKDKKEKDSTLKSPRMPSERVARIMQSYGPSKWQMVQQCGWKGKELPDGSRQDLFCEHLHAQGFLFVKDEYLYYIKVSAECDLPALHSALQDVMKGIDVERQRVCVRTDAASRRRFKSERPRLVTHFKLLDFK